MTVVCTTADSYIDLAVQGPGCVAEMAADRKQAKYATLRTHYDFQPIAVETLGPINESAIFLSFQNLFKSFEFEFLS